MGRAARWLKGLLSGGGGKKKAAGSCGDPSTKPAVGEKKSKGWGFARSFRDKERGEEWKGVGGRGGGGLEERKGSSYREVSRPRHHGSSSMDASSTSSSCVAGGAAAAAPEPVVVVGDGNEENKRAIAVAAATAAVAEAAVAAAQAAAAVVKLTSRGRVYGTASGRRSEEWAAIKIQSAFRGYLARRALKALKGLVKLQALVRGHIVRKQAVETLRCMQALVRVQSRARAGRAITDSRTTSKASRQHRPGPPTPDKYEPATRANGAKPVRSIPLGRSASKANSYNNSYDPNLSQSSSWNWLDRWMEERYWDSRESLSRAATATDDEKILEIDAGKPHLNSKWRNTAHLSICSSLTSDQNCRGFVSMPDSPSKDSTIVQHSIPSPGSVGMPQSLSPLRFPVEAEELSESPQFYSATSRTGCSRRGSFTPTKSDSRSLFSGYSDYPNYMSNTESSKAKLRSQSAPRQRLEFEKSASVKRLSSRVAGTGDVSSSSSSQRSSSLHLKFTGKAYPGSGRLDRLGMPIRG